MIVHDRPDRAVQLKWQRLERLRENKARGSQQEYVERLREACCEDLWFLIRCVFGWHWLDEKLHGQELMRFLAAHEKADTLLLIPRGHIKTMFHSAWFTQQILRNPNIAILAASATQDLTKGIGGLISDALMSNELLQAAFPGILPSSSLSTSRLKKWGIKGYVLPFRKPRVDDTLFCTSVGANVTGRHPDVIWLDDIIVPGNNNPDGFREVEDFINTCKALLPPHGLMRVTGTRYNDGDCYGRMIKGEIGGNQGDFNYLVKSCWTQSGEPIYPSRERWTSEEPSGFSKELLDRKKRDMRAFFNAQYLNDPAPEEDQVLQVGDIEIYRKAETPVFGDCHNLGIEITGGGRLIYNLLEEEAYKREKYLPLVEMTNPRKKGVSKEDRIVAALEPIVRTGRLHARQWMIPSDLNNEDCLGYEIRRLGAARHNDIADCLHNIIEHLISGSTPDENQAAELYIGTDLAWSEGEQADWTVIMAVCVTPKGDHWVLDYDRFRLKSPATIVNRIIEFYDKWNHKSAEPKASGAASGSFALSYN